jgi:DNA-binding NtrC family response regulator
MKRQWDILVVDDEEVMRESLAAWLREDGYRVDTASSGQEALALARGGEYEICFIDLKMPGGLDGLETMNALKVIHPSVAVVIITAYATVDTAVAAMKQGAQEYIVKPCNPQDISLIVSRIVKVRDLQRENAILRKSLTRQYQFHDIISKNSKMQEILRLIREVADLPSTVLIQGESGTGKELIARAIHYSGNRANKPFIAVSCAALAETLLESELFGHEKGSFTGAGTLERGKFELADGGTIFLDDIGDVSPKLQGDLLRVLQERTFYRVGGSEELHVEVRVIAATNMQLRDAVDEGRFRDDLFYRLNVISIRIPPLRERQDDVPLLARAFVERFARELRRDVVDLDEEALRTLMGYSWPGNVRELENAIERAIVTCKHRVLTGEDFVFLKNDRRDHHHWAIPNGMSLAELEREVIAATLERAGGNVKEAASRLGIDRSTLYDKIRKHGIPR